MPIYEYTPVFKNGVIWKYTQQIYLLFSSYLFDEEIKGVYISDIFFKLQHSWKWVYSYLVVNVWDSFLLLWYLSVDKMEGCFYLVFIGLMVENYGFNFWSKNKYMLYLERQTWGSNMVMWTSIKTIFFLFFLFKFPN